MSLLQHGRSIAVLLVAGAILGLGSLFAHGPNDDDWDHGHHTTSDGACAYACSQLGHGDYRTEDCTGGVYCECKGGT